MFDCVLPTRMGRHGTALTMQGKLNLKSSKVRYDDQPIDDECDCYTCKIILEGIFIICSKGTKC